MTIALCFDVLRTGNEDFIRFDNLSAGDYLKCFIVK